MKKHKKPSYSPELLKDINTMIRSDDPLLLGMERKDEDLIVIEAPFYYKGFTVIIGQRDGVYIGIAQEANGLYNADGRFTGMQLETTPVPDFRLCGQTMLMIIDAYRMSGKELKYGKQSA